MSVLIFKVYGLCVGHDRRYGTCTRVVLVSRPLGGLRHHPACLVGSLRGIKGCVRVILDLNGD